jgi:phosphate transport system ATP-binding protein
VRPEVILMDEPCSALDPFSTPRVEGLIRELADFRAFMLIEPFNRSGEMVGFAPTAELFQDARDPRTRDYVSGRFG